MFCTLVTFCSEEGIHMADSSKIVIGTHDGPFHADDVVASALFYVLFPNREIEVVRTKDQAQLFLCNFRVDTGRKNCPDTGDYDHHQPEGAGERSNGVPYASAGLVWKHFGAIQFTAEVFERIDRNVIQTVDSHDYRRPLFTSTVSGVQPCTLPNFIQAFCSDWTEKADFDGQFNVILPIVVEYIKREIIRAMGAEHLKETLQRAITYEDGRVLELECYCPWKDWAKNTRPTCLFVIYPARGMEGWMIEAVYGADGKYKRLLSEAWAGKEGSALVEATGISGALFCHRQRFCARAVDKESVLELARLVMMDG